MAGRQILFLIPSLRGGGAARLGIGTYGDSTKYEVFLMSCLSNESK